MLQYEIEQGITDAGCSCHAIRGEVQAVHPSGGIVAHFFKMQTGGWYAIADEHDERAEGMTNRVSVKKFVLDSIQAHGLEVAA